MEGRPPPSYVPVDTWPRPTGLLATLKKIFNAMAVVFFVWLLGWLVALAWLVFSKAV